MKYLRFTPFILITILPIFSVQAQDNPDFYLNENGITVMCSNAEFGDTGELNGITYTKRTKEEIQNSGSDTEIATSCTSGITDMSTMLMSRTSFNEDISSWDVSNVTNMDSLFFDVRSFDQPLAYWDVSQVTSMYKTFFYALDFNQSIDSWDVSNVTDMSYMFFNAQDYNQPINSWDVSKVTDMSYMFSLALDFNQPINSWDVSNVTDMSYMFRDAQKFNETLKDWNVSNVTDMSGMFLGAPIFNQPINSWDVSNVTDMSGMFHSAARFNQPLNDWDVSKVTLMKEMFRNARSLFTYADMANWDVSNVTDMSGMFRDATLFNAPINDWDVSNVTTMEDMFNGAERFNQSLNDWDVSNVTDMQSMFRDARDFNGVIENWDVSNVTDMSAMFYNARAFNQSLNDWNVSNVTDMQSMFRDARDFNESLNDWNVSNVTDMSYMFYIANSFNQPIGNWDVGNVTNMSNMFYIASRFNQPIGDWNVSKVTNMVNMFANANDFNQPIDTWDVSNVTNMETMFINTANFNQSLNDWDVSNVENMKAMFASTAVFNGDIGRWNVSSVSIDGMGQMLQYAKAFNKDLSLWCVSQIPSEPTNFNHMGIMLEEYKPVWGTCESVPYKIRLISPEDSTSNTEISQKFTWLKETRATHYQFQIKESDSIIVNQINTFNQVDDTISTDLLTLDYDKSYNWRVRGVNEEFDTFGEWSDEWNLTTTFIEGVELTYPINGETESIVAKLYWNNTQNGGTKADSHQVQLSTDDFKSVIFDTVGVFNPSTSSSPNLITPKLDYTTTYYWRVRGIIGNKSADWSQTENFITEAATIPEKIRPLNPSGCCYPNDLRFSWFRDSSSTIYQFQLRDSDSMFVDTLDIFNTIEDTVFTEVSDLTYNKSYIWRVRGINIQNVAGEWSEQNLFRINVEPFPTPTLVYPSNEEENVGIVSAFSWSANPFTQEYHIQVSEDSTFNDDPMGQQPKVNLIIPRPPNDVSGNHVYESNEMTLDPSTTYYWRVKAQSIQGLFSSSNWSSAAKFTTGTRTSIEEELLPNKYLLNQNYPNPFNPSTQIQYALPEATQVTLEVFNSVGQKVMELVNGQQSAGYHTATFNAAGLSSGVYLYKLTTPSFTETKKMLLIK